MRPRWASTPRGTDRLTVGRNATLTLTIDNVKHIFSPRSYFEKIEEAYEIMLLCLCLCIPSYRC
jgi:hypothetical protein